jgi:hypothetical protein
LIKSACKPFTIGYNPDKSKLISEEKVEDVYKVQYIELRADNMDSAMPKKTFKFEKDQLNMMIDTAMVS